MDLSLLLLYILSAIHRRPGFVRTVTCPSRASHVRYIQTQTNQDHICPWRIWESTRCKRIHTVFYLSSIMKQRKRSNFWKNCVLKEKKLQGPRRLPLLSSPKSTLFLVLCCPLRPFLIEIQFSAIKRDLVRCVRTDERRDGRTGRSASTRQLNRNLLKGQWVEWNCFSRFHMPVWSVAFNW